MLLDDVLSHGPGALRLAEPGEFTRRAFLNGRIDLSQAEAVLALIRARSEAELLAAASKLGGSVSRRCAALQEEVTALRVQVEAALDFAEQDIELIGQEQLLRRCRDLRRQMSEEAAKGRGEIASDGRVHVVICGPPNAGKSSLLNCLADADTAIVHPRAGTTRDAVRAEIEVAGVFFRLTDTAGLTADAAGPDAEAVRRAEEQIRSCQLLVLVVDGSAPPAGGVTSVPKVLPQARVLCVVNKCDLPQVLNERDLDAAGFAYETVHTSALTGEGLDGLREALGRTVAEGRLDASAADCLFNARQRSALRRAERETRLAERAVLGGMGYEFAAVNLRAAADALGEVTGEVSPQDVLGRIFGQFCIGK
jgi:tRNA modification GTPase